MGSEILGIQPSELKFIFELKKPSSCSVQLFNNSDQYVAFKVKTTSPRRYSVRPHSGVICPKSTCDFTVIMQAQQEAPPNFKCKDKFLIQSTVVPVGTNAEDITSSMFSKDVGKCIEEHKLKVVLIAPLMCPIVLPVNGTSRQELSYASSVSRYRENLPLHMAAKDAKGLQFTKVGKVFQLSEDLEDLKLSNEVKKLKSKLTQLELKLTEAKITIRTLEEEKFTTTEQRSKLQEELEILRRENGARKVQVGFPFLFVCMVAIACLRLGYFLKP